MSVRGLKRARAADEGVASKRRRAEPPEPELALRPLGDLKMSSIYNRGAAEAPAELFRKDLISAMKLCDSEPLALGQYWVVADTWKQEWERGVQVPVNPDSLPVPKVTPFKSKASSTPPKTFSLPKDKYVVTSGNGGSAAGGSYDLDAIDTAWLKVFNVERARCGQTPLTADQLERVIEELEVQTWEKIQSLIKSEEGLGIEYDENVICDVCRSPDSEDGNEMVFCDACNICVHQACYGITVIPEGQWLCRPCEERVRPTCVLCPNQGGAMKCTPSGHKWAHVSCVLWIPEVSIGCAQNMEPITKISAIPASRWSLLCVLCRERKGACIQCSVKTCKTAYHVTCAFKHGLEMRAIIEDETADDGVKLRSYCQKHSVNSKKEKSTGSGSEEEEAKKKRRKDMTSEEKSQARAAKLQEIESEFDRHVTVNDISLPMLDIDQDAFQYIYNYWKVKRRAGHNRPLLPPKSDDSELLKHKQEQADLDKMRMFVQLRQDLERVRNLCYMVSRREKLSRSFFRLREQTFHKQVVVLTSEKDISGADFQAIVEANHGPSIYDRLYSHPNALDHKNDFKDLLARIAPYGDKNKERNGIIKPSSILANPYRKHYLNGSRRGLYGGFSTDEEEGKPGQSKNRLIGSSTDEEIQKVNAPPKKKVTFKLEGKPPTRKSKKKEKERRRRRALKRKARAEIKKKEREARRRKKKERSSTLKQMEKEMDKVKRSGSDSDELMPIKSSKNNKFSVDIYSDSSEDMSMKDSKKNRKLDVDEKTDSAEHDIAQPLPRTKAAMKEFIPSQIDKKSPTPKEEKLDHTKKVRKSSKDRDKMVSSDIIESDDFSKNKENIKTTSKQKDPTDLIVPQRQAAKKASESIRSTTSVKKDDLDSEKILNADKSPQSDDVKLKSKIKTKETKSQDVTDKIKEITDKKSSKYTLEKSIDYVPQRQAAKKAAAHIKSGLGSKISVTESADTDKKKEVERLGSPKTNKVQEAKSNKIQSIGTSSSSTSSTSSGSSCSSCCSDEETEKLNNNYSAKFNLIDPIIRQKSLFSPPGPRPTVDLPFLDKVSRPLSSTSASSDSEASRASRSGSESPSRRRPLRRRKGKRTSTDLSEPKAPDKKLKTSERRAESLVKSVAVKREEPEQPGDAADASRAGARSAVPSGDVLNHVDAVQGRRTGDETTKAASPNKYRKESGKPGEPAPKWEKDEEIKTEIKEEPLSESQAAAKSPCKVGSASLKRSPSIDSKAKCLENAFASLVKSNARKKEEANPGAIASRRSSSKESTKDVFRIPDLTSVPISKERKSSKYKETNKLSSGSNLDSALARSVECVSALKESKNKSAARNEFIHNTSKTWVSAVPSPIVHPPSIEKLGGQEKYMTEDKSLDVDVIDKSSVKMIAKIQANLNENMMIKSPKTPMDARTVEHMDVDTAMNRISRKRSIIDEKKLTSQDTNHMHGVEISKSAKIPVNSSYQNRSIFSPQPKDNELFEFDMLAVDVGFNNEDMMKPFTSYPEFFFKEDSKEQGVQETLNLVDRLRSQLSSKKVSVESSNQDESAQAKDDKKDIDAEKSDSVIDPNSKTEPCTENVSTIIAKKPSPPKNEYHTETIVEPNCKQTEIVVNHTPTMDVSDDNKWPNADTPAVSSTPDKNSPAESYKADAYNEVDKDSAVQPVISPKQVAVYKSHDDQHITVESDNHIPDNQSELSHNTPYDNNNSMFQNECATISSPYSRESKWAESKIATRRSSTSSTNSEGTVCSTKSDLKNHTESTLRSNHTGMEIDQYPPMPPYSCSIEASMALSQYSAYPPEASQFLGTIGAVPLFTSSGCVTSGSGLFPSGLPYVTAPLVQPLTKPVYPTLCAAFTSSSQNMALTAAMVAPPTPKPSDSPRLDQEPLPVHAYHEMEPHSQSSTAAVTPTTPKMPSENTEVNVDDNYSPSGKSPCKPIKTSKLVTRSPGKSPVVSPRPSEAYKATKRLNYKNNKPQRGRAGRTKNRLHGIHGYPVIDYSCDSIQSKLVGTVYDFDEDVNDATGVDLKALRDRRKSVDLREERKSEHSQNDKSPEFQATQTSEQSAPPEDKLADSPASSPSVSVQVAPVLPGPVDMRTYHSCEAPAAPPPHPFHSHLLAFASGTADQQLPDIDEEVEKQLHTELMASKPPVPTVEPNEVESTAPAPAVTAPPPAPAPPAAFVPPHVSLSDSRNQLKVKIKGPFLDANYCTSSAPPVVAPQPPPPPPPVNNTAAGSTNLRRMRKKELLRQYWTQDMNMDEGGPVIPPPPAAPPPPIARAVITIPKAVASMTSIPTREDYDAPVEKKKRKVSSMSRELRRLEIDDESAHNKKRGRGGRGLATPRVIPPPLNPPPAPAPATSTLPHPLAPKLKIKIGAEMVRRYEDDASHFRPPKKRLAIQTPKPSLEDLRRESMKYRRMVMADFEESDEPTKPPKTAKSEKRKKKKEKKSDSLLVVNSKSDTATKLIIKIKRPKDEAAVSSATTAQQPPVDPFEYDPSAPDPLAIEPPLFSDGSFLKKLRTAKVTPIRLKISRSATGSEYVTKEASDKVPADCAPER